MNGEPATPDLPKPWSASDRPVARAVVQPLQRFMEEEVAGGIVMLAAAAVALLWANSAFHESYAELWGTVFEVKLGSLVHLEHTLQEWVNDGLMTFFFFLVAVEVKRELVFGELRDPRKAALPILAAVGGMAVPALIFLAWNLGEDSARGWGIPVATDIAFAVGVVTLAGRRVPPAGKVFLLTLAIADDIGGILVIALFYAESVSAGWLAFAAACVAGIVVARRADVRSIIPYIVLGVFTWFAFLESGVHATIAGVVVGLLIPTRSFYSPAVFADAVIPLVRRIQRSFDDGLLTEGEEVENAADMNELIRLSRESLAPMARVAHALEPWVAFVIVPIFALANAGVRVLGGEGAWEPSVIYGVAMGLVLGKPLGVVAATWISVKVGVGRLPTGATWRHIVGLGVTAGIGFTVALFVAELSFDEALFTDSAKIGILGASLVAGMLGLLALRSGGSAGERDEEAEGEARPRDAEHLDVHQPSHVPR